MASPSLGGNKQSESTTPVPVVPFLQQHQQQQQHPHLPQQFNFPNQSTTLYTSSINPGGGTALDPTAAMSMPSHTSYPNGSGAGGVVVPGGGGGPFSSGQPPPGCQIQAPSNVQSAFSAPVLQNHVVQYATAANPSVFGSTAYMHQQQVGNQSAIPMMPNLGSQASSQVYSPSGFRTNTQYYAADPASRMLAWQQQQSLYAQQQQQQSMRASPMMQHQQMTMQSMKFEVATPPKISPAPPNTCVTSAHPLSSVKPLSSQLHSQQSDMDMVITNEFHSQQQQRPPRINGDNHSSTSNATDDFEEIDADEIMDTVEDDVEEPEIRQKDSTNNNRPSLIIQPELESIADRASSRQNAAVALAPPEDTEPIILDQLELSNGAHDKIDKIATIVEDMVEEDSSRQTQPAPIAQAESPSAASSNHSLALSGTSPALLPPMLLPMPSPTPQSTTDDSGGDVGEGDMHRGTTGDTVSGAASGCGSSSGDNNGLMVVVQGGSSGEDRTGVEGDPDDDDDGDDDDSSDDCGESGGSGASDAAMLHPNASTPPGASSLAAGMAACNQPGSGSTAKEVFSCHLCSYSGTSKFHFNSHMNSHYEHVCQYCDYTSRTEGRLKRHVKDFHSDIAGSSLVNAGATPLGPGSLPVTPSALLPLATGLPGTPSGIPSASTPGPAPSTAPPATKVVRSSRPKCYRCKQCQFLASSKVDFWEHSRSHIKEEKLLQCPKCPFVTEYKHHLEYHLRNHFGSKPFKCSKCNYSCVNKSMLNSHMKSHTNIYQYRCADCSYATKYCHSLKLHLRKYDHRAASVMTADGTMVGVDADGQPTDAGGPGSTASNSSAGSSSLAAALPLAGSATAFPGVDFNADELGISLDFGTSGDAGANRCDDAGDVGTADHLGLRGAALNGDGETTTPGGHHPSSSSTISSSSTLNCSTQANGLHVGLHQLPSLPPILESTATGISSEAAAAWTSAAALDPAKAAAAMMAAQQRLAPVLQGGSLPPGSVGPADPLAGVMGSYWSSVLGGSAGAAGASAGQAMIKCNSCGFVATSWPVIMQHVFKAHANEHNDLFRAFGVSPELLADLQKCMLLGGTPPGLPNGTSASSLASNISSAIGATGNVVASPQQSQQASTSATAIAGAICPASSTSRKRRRNKNPNGSQAGSAGHLAANGASTSLHQQIMAAARVTGANAQSSTPWPLDLTQAKPASGSGSRDSRSSPSGLGGINGGGSSGGSRSTDTPASSNSEPINLPHQQVVEAGGIPGVGNNCLLPNGLMLSSHHLLHSHVMSGNVIEPASPASGGSAVSGTGNGNASSSTSSNDVNGSRRRARKGKAVKLSARQQMEEQQQPGNILENPGAAFQNGGWMSATSTAVSVGGAVRDDWSVSAGSGNNTGLLLAQSPLGFLPPPQSAISSLTTSAALSASVKIEMDAATAAAAAAVAAATAARRASATTSSTTSSTSSSTTGGSGGGSGSSSGSGSSGQGQQGGQSQANTTSKPKSPGAASYTSMNQLQSPPPPQQLQQPPGSQQAIASASSAPTSGSPKFECQHCEMLFRDVVMYTIHMGYHGYQDPFKCNMCGSACRDRVDFFLHIARQAHM